MSRKIKPNKLFNDAPKTKDNETSTMNDSMNAPQSEAEKPLGGEEVVSSNSPLPNANDESLFDGLN